LVRGEGGRGVDFRPEDGKYILIARLQMGDWSRIAATLK
jgi:hypothetical protein